LSRIVLLFHRVLHCLRCRVSSHSCRRVFASEFLSSAFLISPRLHLAFRLCLTYRLVFASRIVQSIVQSSFRVSSRLRLAYCLVFVSRIVYSLCFVYRSLFHVLSIPRFAYIKLLKSSCIALILRFIIVDSLLRDSTIPEATPSSQYLITILIYT